MRHNLRDSKGRFVKNDSISTIKREGNFWIDQHNNRWDAERYSKEEAEEASASLINCKDCMDCKYCIYCSNCSCCRVSTDCRNCSNCRNCIRCTNCTNCTNCTECSVCNYCHNCVHCTECSDCNRCHYCRYCIECRDCLDCNSCSYCNGCKTCESFSDNPERIIGPIMGSRNERPIVYWTEIGKEQCVIGCFRGTLNELEKAVEKAHKYNEKYLTQYRKFIKSIRAYQKMMK